MRKSVSLFLAVLILLTAMPQLSVFGLESSTVTNFDAAYYDNIIDKETAFIASCQLPSGAIAMQNQPMDVYGGGYKVMPYFSNLAALGLLERAKYAPVVKKYMDWYFSHLNTAVTDYNKVSGTVYDYQVDKDGVTETPTNGYDSTDSYPATFFSLLRKYYEVTGDSQYLIDHQSQLDLIGGAMLSTLENGLTYAKPDYRIQYLMDNAEVHKGLTDAEWIYGNVIKDNAKSTYYANYKQTVGDTIENALWIAKDNLYSYYRDDAGNLGTTILTNFYADATAQLFPIWEELLSPTSQRALDLYNTFCKNFPGWPELQNAGDYPWAIMVYTGAVMGDKARVDTYLETVKEKYIDQGHPHNWYVLEAGMTALAAAKIKDVPAREGLVSITSVNEGDTVTTLPLKISGIKKGTDKVEVNIVHKLTGNESSVETAVDNDSVWFTEFPSLLNGDYSVTVRAMDKFNNYYSSESKNIKLDVDLGGDKISGAVLSINKSTLQRGESTKLRLTTYINDGNKRADPSLLKVDYISDRPELFSIDDKGNITLKQLGRSVTSFQLWANVTLANNLVQSNRLTINISSKPMTALDAILDAEAAYIAGKQLDSGAFATGSTKDGSILTDPMTANFAAMGLVGRPEYAGEVKKYIDWYVGRMNWPDKNSIYGTVYDYSTDAAGVETASDTYATAASRIASFISLVKRYGDVTGDYSGLNQYQLDVMTGGIGILGSQDADGLFWEKPENKYKSMVDNSITIKGMYDSIWLMRNVSKAGSAADYFKSFADGAVYGFENNLFDAASNSYVLGMDAANVKTSPVLTDIDQAVKELEPICNGILAPDSEKAKSLYQEFNKNHPNWSELDQTDYRFDLAAYASVIMGDKELYTTFFMNYKHKLIDNGGYKKLDLIKSGVIMLAAEKAGK